MVDHLIDYTRDSAAANFLGNLGREVLGNPIPLVVIGIGITWLMVASGAPPGAIANAADAVAESAERIHMATSAAVRTDGSGPQT
jgi:hypothetical protein